MAKPFSKMHDDYCPWCKNVRSKEVKLRVESREGDATLYIVCSEGCGFDMTEPDYDSAKLAGRL